MPTSPRRLLLFNLVALTVSLVVAGLCAEILVRASGNDHPLVWRPDPEIGWRHVPGATVHWTEEGNAQVRINSLGLRDVERTIAKAPGTYRIAVFGDSMTEAVQVNLDQTYTQLLEQSLRKRGLNVEVINFGVNGFSPLQEYLLFDRVGKAFKPDLVLQATFTDNDIADCDRKLAAGQVGAPFVQQQAADNLQIDFSAPRASTSDYDQEPVHSVRRAFATYRFLGAWRRMRHTANTAGAALAATGGIPKRHFVYLDPSPPDWDVAWSIYEKILSAFAADARSAGARFAVISVPAGQVVDPSVWPRVLDEFPAMKSKPWNLRGPEEHIRRLASSHDVPLIQPLSEFEQSVSGPPMYFNGAGPKTQNGMGHMTPRGHEVMARAIEKQLERLELVPGLK